MSARPGWEGEEAAAAFLRSLGYHVLERNYRCPAGEIDIIAEHQGSVCIVEVKSRSSLAFGAPAEAVNRAKQKRLARAAAHFLQKHFRRDVACRFDVVTILPDAPPELIPDAFRIEW